MLELSRRHSVTVTPLPLALDRGERQLWAGAPRKGLVFRGSDVMMIPFTLLWLAFAVFWEMSALSSSGSTLFAVWGIPFICVGIYMTLGRFFADASRRGRTRYAVTSERILIEVGRFGPFVATSRSLPLSTLSQVQLQEGRDGTGTISFGPQPFGPLAFGSQTSGVSWQSGPATPSFELVPDCRRVYDIVREAQRATGVPSVA
jgi:hypothetical protein